MRALTQHSEMHREYPELTFRNNEVLAREGIDTVIEVPTSSILTPVTMRY